MENFESVFLKVAKEVEYECCNDFWKRQSLASLLNTSSPLILSIATTLEQQEIAQATDQRILNLLQVAVVDLAGSNL